MDQVTTARFSCSLTKYWQLFEHLCLSKEDAVCYKYYFSKSRKFKELICVPLAARVTIMKDHHDTEACGHVGPARTVYRVREKFYFPGMTAEIKLYCNTCEVCFLNNHGYQKNPRAPLKLFPASRPGEFLSIDLIGQIKGSSRYKWILCRQKLAYDKKKGFHTTYATGDHVMLWKPLSPTIKNYRKNSGPPGRHIRIISDPASNKNS